MIPVVKKKNVGVNLNDVTKTFVISVRDLTRNPHFVKQTDGKYTNEKPNTGTQKIQTGWSFSSPMPVSEAHRAADELASALKKMGYVQVKHDEVV